MKPVFYKTLSICLQGGTLALGNFIFMMRKHQIFATQVHIECRAEQFHAHGAALDVPTRASFAPWGWPENCAILSRSSFPERKIGNRFFSVFIAAHPFSNAHLVEIQMHQLTVLMPAASIFLYAEINGAIWRLVRQT